MFNPLMHYYWDHIAIGHDGGIRLADECVRPKGLPILSITSILACLILAFCLNQRSNLCGTHVRFSFRLNQKIRIGPSSSHLTRFWLGVTTSSSSTKSAVLKPGTFSLTFLCSLSVYLSTDLRSVRFTSLRPIGFLGLAGLEYEAEPHSSIN